MNIAFSSFIHVSEVDIRRPKVACKLEMHLFSPDTGRTPVCFRCEEPGHTLSNCKEPGKCSPHYNCNDSEEIFVVFSFMSF